MTDSPRQPAIHGSSMSPSIRLQLLKWSAAILLAAMVVGGAALIHFGPVRGYAIKCDKAQQISCVLQRHTSSGPQSWQVPLGAGATATVQVKTYRRSRPRVFLYLNTPTAESSCEPTPLRGSRRRLADLT